MTNDPVLMTIVDHSTGKLVLLGATTMLAEAWPESATSDNASQYAATFE
jgi:hypothetical protein